MLDNWVLGVSEISRGSRRKASALAVLCIRRKEDKMLQTLRMWSTIKGNLLWHLVSNILHYSSPKQDSYIQQDYRNSANLEMDQQVSI